MKTRFFIMLAIVIPVFAIFGCGGDEEDVIQLLKTDPPDGGEIGNLGTLTMTFDAEPTTVNIDSPAGSRAAKITGKTATYTFTTQDQLVPGGKVPIGISWISKGGSTGSKIVRLTIVAGGNGANSKSDNTKIAYVRDDNIWVMNADGSNQRNITPGVPGGYPTWSPSGEQIAFMMRGDEGGTYIMNADGSNQRKISMSSGALAWSPLGEQIAFDIGFDIWVMNTDGSNVQKITSYDDCALYYPHWCAGWPSWSPSGKQIVYGVGHDIWVMNADGSNKQEIASDIHSCSEIIRPSWSPSGEEIAYENEYEYQGGDIWVMDPYGGNHRNITNTSREECEPVWSPSGKQIAFISANDIWVVNTDGSNVRRLTNTSESEKHPAWSPK